MKRINCFLITFTIFLLITRYLSFGIAGELKIYSSEGIKTYYFQDPDSSNSPQDRQKAVVNFKHENYRKVSEECIRGCAEEEVGTKALSKLPEKTDSGGLEKTIPEKAPAERISQAKDSPEKTALVKHPSEKSPMEEISTAKPSQEKTYDETVSEWKSYQDLVKWMENDFSFDGERYQKFEGTLPVPRTPEETFQLRAYP